METFRSWQDVLDDHQTLLVCRALGQPLDHAGRVVRIELDLDVQTVGLDLDTILDALGRCLSQCPL